MMDAGGRTAQIGLRSSTGDSRGLSTLEYARQNTRRVAVTFSDFVEGVGLEYLTVNTAAIHHGLIVTSPETLVSGLKKEVGETIVLCGFQRGDRASTPGLGRASTRQYSPSQPQPMLNRAACEHFLLKLWMYCLFTTERPKVQQCFLYIPETSQAPTGVSSAGCQQ